MLLLSKSSISRQTVNRNLSKLTTVFKITKRNLYYNNISVERNLNFVLNLGYNKIPNIIKSNITISKLFTLIFRFFLKREIKKRYITLLSCIEKGDIETLSSLLEPNLKMTIFRDISTFSKQKYRITLVNENSPIFIKILSVYELENLNIDRDLNGDIRNYKMVNKSKNRLVIQKVDNNDNIFRMKNRKDLEKEREMFSKSEYSIIAHERLYNEIEFDFNLEYAKKKLGGKIKNEQQLNFITNLIETLKKVEKDTSEESKLIRDQYHSYFTEKKEYIEKTIKTHDLFEYFAKKMNTEYTALFSSQTARKKGFFGSVLTWFKTKWLGKFAVFSRKVSTDKILYVYDVEVSSKLRLEILDENGENILESIYDYTKLNKSSKSLSSGNENLNYDTSLYNFNLPDLLWNYNNKEYHQKHVLRIEFEKKRRFKNIWKNPYTNMLITDIDLAMKGNNHFKFEDNDLI